MKKRIVYILVIIALFMFGINNTNAASDVVNNFKMEIYINESGDALVTETWDANAKMGTEFYHTYNNVGTSEFTDFSVTMDGKPYEYVNHWNVNASISDKAYKNGINKISDGVELCFGKTSLGKHTYIVKYTITNFILKLSDTDMAYWTLIPYENQGMFKNVYIKLSSFYKFPDTLDVWGYGNGGTAYVYNGIIEMQPDGALDNDEYMTILVKFPKDTFNTIHESSYSFSHFYDLAEEGAIHNDGSNYGRTIKDIILGIVFLLFNGLIWLVVVISIIKSAFASGNTTGSLYLDYGERGKKIPKDIPNWREIPCGKDIFEAYYLSEAFGLSKKKTDFLGAILLKWIKEDKVSISKVESKILKKETSAIDLKDATFDNDLETELYDMMKIASKDGILEDKEFEKWCKNNYKKILDWFEKVLKDTGSKLVVKGYLVLEEKKNVFSSKKYKVQDIMFDEAYKLYGLKKFLIEFSSMDDKEAIDVKIWDEYLMFAQIFGIAEKVAKQFKKLYPDVITDYNYSSVIFVHNICYTGMTSASSAYSRASSYSSGGGGFSSFGGGGGSFGGGGGGGMGGR